MDPSLEELEAGGMDEDAMRRLMEAMGGLSDPDFDDLPSEPTEEALSADASDALAEAAEAFFEGDTDAAVAHGRRAVELAPSASRAHSMLVQALQCKSDWEAALDAACDWAAACGPSAGQLSALLRSSYRVGSKSLVLAALDGMCKTEVEDDEFALAQACAADMAASAQVGQQPAEAGDGGDAASAVGTDGTAAKPSAAASAAAESEAATAGARPVPPRLPAKGGAAAAAGAGAVAELPTPAAAFGAWCVRCDQGRAAGAARLGRLAAAAVSAATSGEVAGVPEAARVAWKLAYGEEGALATLSVCLGLLAAEAAAGGGTADLRSAWVAAEAAGLVGSAVADTEGTARGIARLGSQPDANVRCARAVLMGARMSADEAAACEDRADMIVWRHCGPVCRPVDA